MYVNVIIQCSYFLYYYTHSYKGVIFYMGIQIQLKEKPVTALLLAACFATT